MKTAFSHWEGLICIFLLFITVIIKLIPFLQVIINTLTSRMKIEFQIYEWLAISSFMIFGSSSFPNIAFLFFNRFVVVRNGSVF